MRLSLQMRQAVLTRPTGKGRGGKVMSSHLAARDLLLIELRASAKNCFAMVQLDAQRRVVKYVEMLKV